MNRVSTLFKYIFAVSLFLLSFKALAQGKKIPSLPNDFSNVEIYLGTRDIGHQAYTKYGHTILRVVNHENRTDVGYNWGTFDFNEPGFIPKFLKGFLIYQMSYGNWGDEVETSIYEQQTMWMEHINLTAKQKKSLLERINWQAQPENRKYPYLFFYDNCSTRVRDYLDEALGGKIKAQTGNQMIGKTYRDRVMEHNASEPILAMGQDVILNNEPDREMSKWDDMFIPIYLREYLLAMPAIDDNGNEVPGKTLLSDTQVLTDFPRPEIPLFNGFAIVCLLVGGVAILGLFLVKSTTASQAGIRMIGLSTAILGLLWGSLGLFMSLSWAFGSHTVLPRNVNLLLMWPTDFVYALLGFNIIRAGKLLNPQGKFSNFMATYTYVHLIGMIVLTAIGLTRMVDQNSTRIIIYFVPLSAFVWSLSTLPMRWLSRARKV